MSSPTENNWESYIKGECAVVAAKRREQILLNEILVIDEGWLRQRAINQWNQSARYAGTTRLAAEALVNYEADHWR